MINKLVPLAAALTLAVVANQALADRSAQPLASPLTFDEAIAIALEAQPGTIAEVALERDFDRVVIEIEVVNELDQEVEFKLDAQTGAILSTHIDDDPSDDPEGEDKD
ncbi:MAG: PepSY domain-containing protein [Pseudomonadota bacterium]